MESLEKNTSSLLSKAEDPISLRKLLLTFMSEKKISQTKIFEMSGVAKSSISNYLSGKKSLNCDNLEKIINSIIKNK